MRSWRRNGRSQGDVPAAQRDGRGRRREISAGRPWQARLAARHRAGEPHPPRAQLRRELRLYDLSRHREGRRGESLGDAAGRGRPARSGRGPHHPLAAGLSGGRAWQRGRGDPEVITWRDAEDIAIALSERHPELDPLTVRFTDLHRWVTELPDFKDDPKGSNEKILEKIQMAWLDEYRNR